MQPNSTYILPSISGGTNGSSGVVTCIEYDEKPENGWTRNRVKPPTGDGALLEWSEVTFNGKELQFHDSNRVAVIHVKLDSGNTIAVTRSCVEKQYDATSAHSKLTFPLMLAYAITGHIAQGATIAGKTMVFIHEAFAPGLVYVMLSRLKSLDQLILVWDPAIAIKPSDFKPVPDKYRARATVDAPMA